MSDRDELVKFKNKSFRDGYLQTATRGGVAYQIQALREKFKLTQTAFAEKLGKRQSVVSRLENSEYGKVSVQTLLDVACALDVALLVRFVSYPEFLKRTKDMSISSLQPETIYESVETQREASPSLAKSGGTASAATQNFVAASAQAHALTRYNTQSLGPLVGNDNFAPVSAAAYTPFRQGAAK